MQSRTWALGFKSEMIRPLKWGTLGSRTPGGSKNTSRQIFIFFSSNFDGLYIFLEPLEVREPNLPHFKVLINSDLNPRVQGRDSTFTFCHTLLKKAILEGKRAMRPIMILSSCTYTQFCLIFYGCKVGTWWNFFGPKTYRKISRLDE